MPVVRCTSLGHHAHTGHGLAPFDSLSRSIDPTSVGVAVMLQRFAEMLSYFYPGATPTTEASDPFRRGRLQLRCNRCAARIVRWAPRVWGNPYCGVCYPRPDDVAHQRRPFA